MNIRRKEEGKRREQERRKQGVRGKEKRGSISCGEKGETERGRGEGKEARDTPKFPGENWVSCNACWHVCGNASVLSFIIPKIIFIPPLSSYLFINSNSPLSFFVAYLWCGKNGWPKDLCGLDKREILKLM